MTTNASHPKMAFFRFSALQCAAPEARLRVGVTLDLPFGAGVLPSANPYLATSLWNASRPVLSAESCPNLRLLRVWVNGCAQVGYTGAVNQLQRFRLNVAGLESAV